MRGRIQSRTTPCLRKTTPPSVAALTPAPLGRQSRCVTGLENPRHATVNLSQIGPKTVVFRSCHTVFTYCGCDFDPLARGTPRWPLACFWISDAYIRPG